MTKPLDVVILGLSVTSSWGNGHATTYRGLIRGLAARGHRVLFLERDTPWYAGNRDEPHPRGARTELYHGIDDLIARFECDVRKAALVIVGSFVPEGTRVGQWVTAVAAGSTAFYDIDTPVTLAKLAEGSRDYVTPELIAQYDMYLSFTGGPVLRLIESRYGSPMARELFCSVDPHLYQPQEQPHHWDLGYLGTYSEDRQPLLDELLIEPARHWPQGRFTVAGPLYPAEIRWPENLDREIHLSPREHPAFYASQRFTLNITRAAMKHAGYSPSVRLFEAGACGVPVISDWWEGLDSIFHVDHELLIASTAEDTLRILRDCPESRRQEIGLAARRRILGQHTPERRAIQLEDYLQEVHDHVSPHTPRRNLGNRQDADGMDAGLAPQQQREASGGDAGTKAGAASDPRHLQQSPGARP